MGKVELRFEVDAELVEQARANGHEPREVLERGLREAAERPRRLSLVQSAREKAKDPKGAERRAREWAEASQESLREQAAWVEEHGPFGEAWRSW